MRSCGLAGPYDLHDLHDLHDPESLRFRDYVSSFRRIRSLHDFSLFIPIFAF